MRCRLPEAHELGTMRWVGWVVDPADPYILTDTLTDTRTDTVGAGGEAQCPTRGDEQGTS